MNCCPLDAIFLHRGKNGKYSRTIGQKISKSVSERRDVAKHIAEPDFSMGWV
jgi:hypothetical protein